MTPAVENFKNGWITMIASFVIAMVTVMFGSSLGAKEADKRELQKEIDSKASKEELKNAIDGVRKENNIQNEWIIKTLDRIDKRTERLEDRL